MIMIQFTPIGTIWSTTVVYQMLMLVRICLIQAETALLVIFWPQTTITNSMEINVPNVSLQGVILSILPAHVSLAKMVTDLLTVYVQLVKIFIVYNANPMFNLVKLVNPLMD